MKNWHDKNISFTESLIRYSFGSALVLAVLLLYLKAWISLFSVYLIGTGLIHWDPFYWVVKQLQVNTITKAGGVQALKEGQKIN